MGKVKIEKLIAKNNESTIKINNFLIHSLYNPTVEAEKFADQHFKQSHVNIIFGYGCGQIVQAFEKKITANERLIVVDSVIKPELIGNYFYSNASEKDDLFNFFSKIFNYSHLVHVIISPNYDKALPEQYHQFLKAVKEKLRNDQVSEKTFKLYVKSWQKNYYLNLRGAIRDQSILDLQNKYNCPIVIASGGPSLTKQLDLLKQYRDKFILISSGSTISTLISANIHPDFAMSIDGLEKNYEHYKDIELPNTRLLYTLDNHPKVRWSFTHNCYYFFNQYAHKVMKNFEGYIENSVPVTVPTGMSVANSAFAFSTFLSSGPICLVGQDLAYTGNVSHAANNKSIRKLEETPEQNPFYVYDEGYYGDKIISDNVLVGMKKSFERMAMECNKKDIYNCTEGGVLIKGFENLPFKDFCEQFATEIVQLVDENIQTKTDNIAQELQKLHEKSVKEQQICDEIIEICKKNLKLLESNNSAEKFSQEILKKLDKNDSKMQKLILKTAIAISMTEIDNDIVKYFKKRTEETPEESYTRVFKQSVIYYNRTMQAAEQIKHNIDELHVEIDEELRTL